MDVQQLHLVCVMKRCTLYDSTAELDWFKIGYRSYRSGSSYLIIYADEFCEGLLCLEFIGNCPARKFGCIAEFFLIWKLVYLDDDAVCGKREILSF